LLQEKKTINNKKGQQLKDIEKLANQVNCIEMNDWMWQYRQSPQCACLSVRKDSQYAHSIF